MKKILILLTALVIAFVLAGCGNTDTPTNYSEQLPIETTPPETTGDMDIIEPVDGNNSEISTAETTPTELSADETYSLELCYCGEHYMHEDLRASTPPLGIREPFEWGTTPQQFYKSLYQFETIHRITYRQFEAERHGYSFVIWTDEPLRDFFFASLDVAGHYWYNDGQLIINTQEVLFEIDELLPGDAVVFSVAFSHYLLPHAGIGFTDSNGIHRRMFISESMRGGCWPSYWLAPLEDDGWAVWR